ncbi:MAG: hypothetical protein LBO77_01055 [Desulfovibrio sp.]|jgi:hypothetical protein|nr:hypothetical protein [Desulfovibrio sp.]
MSLPDLPFRRLPVALSIFCFACCAAGFQARAESGERRGWVTIESGGRPAYVGIHGGTAPISLLRASNGLLFAFTGQTGNDFLHVLRGNSTSGNAAGAAPVSQAAPAAAGREPAVPPAGAEAEPPAADVAPAPQDAGLRRPDAVAPDSAARAEAHPAHGDHSLAMAGADRDAPVHPAIPKAVEAILADVPAGGPSLVFASGELAHLVAESGAFAPFGLPLPGEIAAGRAGEGGEARSAPRFRPLKLRDYRPLLRLSGGV